MPPENAELSIPFSAGSANHHTPIKYTCIDSNIYYFYIVLKSKKT
ncbi:hypothetical protein l11_01850 [Neisseria weaveri LMG 5135]|nr:hypothetical protein l11_01850 [Neisseria weaveri LMG 5135]